MRPRTIAIALALASCATDPPATPPPLDAGITEKCAAACPAGPTWCGAAGACYCATDAGEVWCWGEVPR